MDKFTESKRAEMQTMLDSVIQKWLLNIQTKDAASKESLQLGLQNLVKKGDENGIWDVICCASAAHVATVNEMEDLRLQVNKYKENEQQLRKGVFTDESSRVESDDRVTGKRKQVEDSTAEDTYPNDIWSEFQTIMTATQ